MVKTILLMVVSVCLETNVIFACDCATIGNPIQAFEISKAVFTGKVISLKDEGKYIEVTLEVKTSWKGPAIATQVIISTSRFGTACGFTFEEGMEYLIYASSYEAGEGSTNTCSRTRRLSKAKKDIQELTKKYSQKSKQQA